jgi:hypothetical protein
MVRNTSVSRPSSVSAAAELAATSAADNPGRIAENTQPRGEFIDGVRGVGRHDSVLRQVVGGLKVDDGLLGLSAEIAVAGDPRIRPISVQQYLQARHAFARIASGQWRTRPCVKNSPERAHS